MDPDRPLDEFDGLDGLDDAQRQAVIAPVGLVAVIAAAGSGKTTVLTRRIVHRVRSGTADARHVVAITFTRDAAYELQRRLRRERLHDQVVAGTFHATAFHLLRQRWADQSQPVPTVVSDRRRLVAEVLGDRSRRPNGSAVSEVTAEIDWARARLIPPSAYEAEARRAARSTSLGGGKVAEHYAAYEAHKRTRRLIDLDDLLGTLLEAMQRDPTYAEVVRWRFRHLHLDEAQDLNPLQHALLEAWRGDRDDLFLVGDPAQAVYGWNGADAQLLVEVEDRYPGITVVRLDRNFRSTPEVIDVGRHLLVQTALPATITAMRPGGPSVALHGFADEVAEADGVARLVRSMRPIGGHYGSIAVLVRTNAQAALLAERLRAASVPVRPRQGRGSVERVLAEAGAQGGAHRLLAWASEVLDLIPESPADPLDAARRRVALAVDEFVSATGGGDGRSFASWARSTGAVDDDHHDVHHGVELTTFHGAKGREWPVVVIAGFEERQVPHSSARTAEQRAEEIRLAYVAVTRAVNQLVITWAEQRQGRTTGRSRLLTDLDVQGPPVVAPPAHLRSRPPTASDHDRRALDAVRDWRRAAARAADVPEAVVCSDRDVTRLAELASRPTIGVDDIAEVIGPMAARHHAARLLALLSG